MSISDSTPGKGPIDNRQRTIYNPRPMPMVPRLLPFSALIGAMAMLLPVSACVSPVQHARVLQEKNDLLRDKRRIQRTVAQRDGTIARLERQIENLKGFAPDRPADLFAPVKLDIASLSGGADYDGMPGDDGVTVHLRLHDADGSVIKAPGRITIELTDHSNLGAPRVLDAYVFDDPKQLRKSWYGRFGTQHYTLKCPFPPDVVLPDSRKLTVHALFVDYLTGDVLSAVAEVTISIPDR